MMARLTPADFQRLAPESAPSLQDLFDDARRQIDGTPSAPPAEQPAQSATAVTPAAPVQFQPGALVISRQAALTAGGVIAGILIAVALMSVVNRVAPAETATPVQAGSGAQQGKVATSPPQSTAAPPTPTPRPALPVGLALYFGPDAAAAPSLPSATTAYTPTARYLDAWVQLQIAGYAVPVWARADALPGVELANLPAPYRPTPTPAPQVIQVPAPPVVKQVEVPVPCTAANASYWKRGDVTSDKGVPLGHVERFSCLSQAEADQLWAQAAADMKGQ